MKGTRWIVFVIVLLVGNVAAVSGLIAAASGDRDRRVLAESHRSPAAWGQALAPGASSLDVGWQARVTVRPDGLTIAVNDASGQPVASGSVRVAAHHRAHANRGISAVALEAEPGVYRTSGALPLPGIWDVDVSVHRADVAWVRRVAIERVP